jgi:glycine hydroxymethyltransferase
MSHSHAPRLIDVDPQTAALIAAEERRQREKIVLIPSESLTPAPVREALGSVFSSIYAEGYPRKAMMNASSDRLAEIDEQLASYRRYADRRFYKGTEFADLVESLAGRRAAEAFATAEVPAERIHANVQPLSGAAANLSVYDSFVRPGETVMGMALTEGGHLTHGSEFNVTGKRYRIVSYSVDPKTGRLDYERIRRLAEEHRPRLIIGGFTSYPWQPDWNAFREIAHDVGAIFLADVAHTAGLIVGGVYPNPIGIADVMTFTSHKTLCGPRGATILSTDPEIAEKIDAAVFPGLQGGPHVNKFAALAVAFKTARSPEFRDLQRRIVENASHLADALREQGLTLAYGGTDTHLLLIDLRGIESDTGFVMMGEIAARILDLVGIVCNKNTLPGDTSAADAHGIRLGTPWATQRGMGKEEMEILAGIIARVLRSIRPFEYIGLTGELSRGKTSLSVLESARRDVRALIGRIDPSVSVHDDRQQSESGWAIFRVHSGRVRALLNEVTPADLLSLEPGDPCLTFLFDENGDLLSEIVVGQIGDEDYLVLAPRANRTSVSTWLAGLADGYIVFDRSDVFRKVQGPAVVEEIPEEAVPEPARAWLTLHVGTEGNGSTIADVYARSPERFAVHKPYFVGQHLIDPPLLDPDPAAFSWTERESETLERTPLHDAHVDLGARLVPFAGWEMPVWYTSALDEHRAVRECAGLFDLGHMGVFQISGEHATEFLNAVTSNYAAWLEDGQSHYAYLLDPDGRILDDVMVYRRAPDRYLMVVNAVNEAKDWEWLTGVNDGRYLIDHEIPTRRPSPAVEIRDLKRDRGVIDIALQGPLSREILERLLGSEERFAIGALERTGFCELTVDGHQLIVARTGYTGEPLGYEIYVGGSSSRWLWDRLLEVGRPLGLLPCGLAARDSTRTEAGFPLYGHEFAGPYGVDPFEADYGSYVKLHKPFFIGRAHCVTAYRESKRAIIRFQCESGARRVQEGASVLDRNGAVVGRVTSCVSLGETQIGLALLERPGLEPGGSIALLNPPGEKAAGKTIADLQIGDRVPPLVRATVLPRLLAQETAPESGGA